MKKILCIVLVSSFMVGGTMAKTTVTKEDKSFAKHELVKAVTLEDNYYLPVDVISVPTVVFAKSLYFSPAVKPVGSKVVIPASHSPPEIIKKAAFFTKGKTGKLLFISG